MFFEFIFKMFQIKFDSEMTHLCHRISENWVKRISMTKYTRFGYRYANFFNMYSWKKVFKVAKKVQGNSPNNVAF